MVQKIIRFRRGESGKRYLEYELSNGIKLRWQIISVIKENFEDYNNSKVIEELELK